MPGGIEIGARQVAHALKELESAAQQSGEAVQRIDDSTGDRHGTFTSNVNAERAEENPPEIESQALPQLPPAGAPSAGTQDGIGPTQPETRRSVATGRDAPLDLEVSQDRENTERDRDQVRGQTRVIDRRLEAQRSASAEHLSGIHTMLERLLDLTEAHYSDDGQKLQSLEHRLGQMEMRYSLNRTSP
jgi:hypothetical protein